jgi:hypothetical protein
MQGGKAHECLIEKGRERPSRSLTRLAKQSGRKVTLEQVRQRRSDGFVPLALTKGRFFDLLTCKLANKYKTHYTNDMDDIHGEFEQ